MSDQQEYKERPAKRSLTPNRSLYKSYNEAHRNIAPPMPKSPFEQDLRNDEQLTPEQVERVLNDISPPRNLIGKNKVKLGHTEHRHLEESPLAQTVGRAANPSGTSIVFATEPQSKSTGPGLQDDISLDESEDENAFIDSSDSSLDGPQDETSAVDSEYDPLESKNDFNDCPDSSSFYPEDGATFNPNDTVEEIDLNKTKPGLNSSPLLASLPMMPPPCATSPQDPTQMMPHSHFDDITKKQVASDNFEATPMTGVHGNQYPSASAPCVTSMKHETDPEPQYDADISDVSMDQFVDQGKVVTSTTPRNPFHAFSTASSQDSVMDYEQPESEVNPGKVFLRSHAEKEVSRALHHATGLSQPSSGLIVGRTCTRASNPYHSSESPFNSRKQQQDFYHAPAIQPSWKVAQSVKVPVSKSYTETDEDVAVLEETKPYNPIDNTRMVTVASAGQEQAVLEADEDWRTVTDDREDFPNGAVGRFIPGSSIANVSDIHVAPQQLRRVPSTTIWWGKGANAPRMPPTPSTPFPPLQSFPSPPAPVFNQRQRANGWEDIELEQMPSPPRAPFSWERVPSQYHGNEPREHIQLGQYANLPFPLVPREDAARRQAVRRASGLEDQTLSGRIMSPSFRSSSALSASYMTSRTAPRKDSARSTFSRINNPNFDCRVQIPESHQNPFRVPEHEFYSTDLASRARSSQANGARTSTPKGRKMERISPQAAAEALAIDQELGRPMSPHIYSTEVMSRYRAFQAVRDVGGRGTDTELADMAATVNDEPLSLMARHRQRVFYRVIMVTTLFLPFIGHVVLNCRGDGIVSALTRGECSGLSFNQRRNLRMMLLGGMALWCLGVVIGLIAMAVTRT